VESRVYGAFEGFERDDYLLVLEERYFNSLSAMGGYRV
jgi:hypothetical protein